MHDAVLYMLHTAAPSQSALRVLVTCPHWWLLPPPRTPAALICDERNDPGAQECAVEIHRTLSRMEGVHCILLAGSTDRAHCDLNRRDCGIGFHARLERILTSPTPPHLVLDVHSYPRGEAFYVRDGEPSTTLVCRTPRGIAPQIAQELLPPDVTVFEGSDNYVINRATEYDKRALLLEVPYDRTTERGARAFHIDVRQAVAAAVHLVRLLQGSKTGR